MTESSTIIMLGKSRASGASKTSKNSKAISSNQYFNFI
jgi:hypothetical protein